MRAASLVFTASMSLALVLGGCGSDDVTVGKTSSQALKKKDGSATGDGTTCSWTGTAAADAATSSTIRPKETFYSVGDKFLALDGCNTCTCTANGIACTEIACVGSNPTTGSGGSTGDGVACPALAQQCPDGTWVGASGPSCTFSCASTPGGGKACTEEAQLCPDGKTYVSRTGPNCAFAACP